MDTSLNLVSEAIFSRLMLEYVLVCYTIFIYIMDQLYLFWHLHIGILTTAASILFHYKVHLLKLTFAILFQNVVCGLIPFTTIYNSSEALA